MEKNRVLAYKVTRDKIIKALQDIGYTIHGREPWQCITTPRGDNAGFYVMSDRVQISDGKNNCISCCFFYKQCRLEKIGFETVSLTSKNSDKSVFILFHNFDLGKSKH